MIRIFRRGVLRSFGETKEKGPKRILAQKGISNVQMTMNDSQKGRDKIKIDLLIHDLKVPLAVIEAGITSLLKRPEKYGSLTPNQERVLIRTLRNTKITQALVNDALELGRSRKGIVNSTTLRLSGLVEQALVELFDLAHCSTSEEIKRCTDLMGLRNMLEGENLILRIDEALWYQEFCLDEAKVRQILRNLLSNALKYRKKIVELEVYKKEDCLVLAIKDDGEGIPEVYHKKIFESYFQMDATDTHTVRGHGLGLAGVMVLVEDMGGQLFLESDEGKGAKFLVKVPVVRGTDSPEDDAVL
jgi:two-component system OmpR family sensor kinase